LALPGLELAGFALTSFELALAGFAALAFFLGAVAFVLELFTAAAELDFAALALGIFAGGRGLPAVWLPVLLARCKLELALAAWSTAEGGEDWVSAASA
jgi:hypothetical protein